MTVLRTLSLGPGARRRGVVAAVVAAGMTGSLLLAAGPGGGAAASTSSASGPQVVSGTVVAASGTPVVGDVVSIDTAGPPSPTASTWTPVPIGTATTAKNGRFRFTVPMYAALPPAAQADAAGNDGYLNLQVVAGGMVTASGKSRAVAAIAYESAWVGDRTRSTEPDSDTPRGPGADAARRSGGEANGYPS